MAETTKRPRAKRVLRWKLSDDTTRLVIELTAALDEEWRKLDARRGRQSKAWKDTDLGQSVSAWLEDIENLATQLEELDHEVEG